MRPILFALLCVGLQLSSYAQSIVGSVLDAETKEPLVGAYVYADKHTITTDIDGNFSIAAELPQKIRVSFLGYADYEQIIDQSEVTIYMQQEGSVLDIMTVTASKYEKRLSESTVSVEVLQPELIANTNTVEIDAVIEKVPGVQIIDGQANIRGGSGYSYGAGSRVMLLVDDLPALQVDAGRPSWGDIPVENIAQVEVLKGAASALYGSSALNGIIHIRTGNPSAVPQTHLAVGYTSYGDANDPKKQWWGDTARYQYNVSLLHKQKFDKLDVVLGGFYTRQESYNQYTFEKRKRLSAKLKYQLFDKAFIRLNTLINDNDTGSFFAWANDSTGIYQPAFDSPATSKSFRYFIDPSLHLEDPYGNSHKVLTRFNYINNDNGDNQSNSSNTYYGEYQFQRRFDTSNITLTAGAVAMQSDTDAELFGDTTFTSINYAGYVQLEKTFFKKLNLSTGLRYEYNKQLTPESFNDITVPNGEISEGKTIARFGASYEYAPYSSVRVSWGQGYRFPTITEKFIATSFAGFNIVPNPQLQSESGWTAEIGVKQGLRLGAIKGYLDASIFTSEYEDMTEFTFGSTGGFAFASENVGDTKINGVDLGIFATANIGNTKLNVYGGYTWIDPKYKNFGSDSTLLAGLSTDQNVLKYRSGDNVKMDVELSYKSFSIGGAFTYVSHVVNIDRPLESLEFMGSNGSLIVVGDILGIKSYRDKNNSGYTRLDFRISYRYKDWKLSFLINNIANTEYTVRPGLLEAPINYSLRADYTIDWE